MFRKNLAPLIPLIVILALVVSACGPTPTPAPTKAPAAAPTKAPAAAPTKAPAPPTAAPATKDKVTLQLKWVTQSQFAGYYAALEKGFYDAENLDVTINPGGPDIIPEQVVAGGSAEFGLDWLPSLLSAREQGQNLVNVAQVFQYSGMRELAFKTNPGTGEPVGIDGASDLKGKKVAVWMGGNEFELLATLAKYGIDKDKDVELIQQPFDMNLLLNGEVDAAAAMTYNEYHQVLIGKPGNPDKFGKETITPDDLVVIDFNEEGTAMLEDGVFVRQDWLDDPAHQDVAARFLRASFKGWEFCRDDPDQCVDIVMKQGPTLDETHMTWMMTEINKLIWPLPSCAQGIGYLCPQAFQQTADIAQTFGVIENPPGEGAYTHAIWEMAQ